MQSFFDNYFSRYLCFPKHISEAADKNLKTIVVIPCYNEPDILVPLKSLLKCTPTKFPVEVIVVVNSKENEKEDVLLQNQLTISQIEKFKKENFRKDFKIFCLEEKNLPKKHAGVGFARKIGMDEAVRRFQSIENPYGVIVNFDADCTCQENYLSEIENFFLKNPKAEGVTINFEHNIYDKNFPIENRLAIAKYELYMRYYVESLRFAGFPYAFHTVGSAFAVRVGAYCQEGGMNRRQAGEDFYFLHKIIPREKFYNLASTKVFPSIRFSSRVPFGTGISLKQTSQNDYYTYNFDSFLVLKAFFLEGKIAPILKEFLDKNNFSLAEKSMKENSKTKKTYLKRFFAWFDAFRVLKFLNFSHTSCFSKMPVEKEALKLLRSLNFEFQYEEIGTEKLLKIFRDFFC